MSVTIDAGREHYRPSGKVSLVRFLPLSAVAVMMSVVLAGLLFLIFWLEFYFIIIVPAVLALALAGCVAMCVRLGHCRNKWIAGALGLLAGSILYLGYYQFDFANRSGLPLHRVEFLPKYINFRMETDVVGEAGKDVPVNARQGETRTVMNWLLFALESLLVVGIVTAMAVTVASKAYCEEHGRWMKVESRRLPPGSGAKVAGALAGDGALAEAIEGKRAAIGAATNPHCMLTAEYCPDDDEAAERFPVYLTVKEMTKGYKTLTQRCALRDDEIATLAPVLPALSGLVDAPIEAPNETAERQAPPTSGLPRATVRVEQIEPPFGGAVFTALHTIVGGLIELTPAVAAVAGLAAIVAGGWLLTAGLGVLADPMVAKGIGVSGIVLGALAAMLGPYVFFRHPDYASGLYLDRLVRHEIAMRPGSLVDPDDPDSLSVEVLPRKNWGRITIHTATDIGFLHVDRRRREIRFEGDRERYRIPADAVASCDVVPVTLGVGEGKNPAGPTIYATVIEAHGPDGPWEAPIVHCKTRFRKMIGDKRRRELAQQLREQVLDLITDDGDAWEE